MKKNKKCIKCNSTNIIVVPGVINKFIGNGSMNNLAHVGFGTYVEKETYICSDCGYSEEWIKQSDLDVVKSQLGTKFDINKKEE